MAHYAFINSENVVVEVIVGIDENEQIEGLAPEIWYGNFRQLKCLRTSYNGKIRKNYAGIGYTYDEDLDAFINPKQNCHSDEFFDQERCLWICVNEEHTPTL